MTVEGLSHTYACIHSPPNPCPIQAATWHWADLPMLYNRMFLFCKWVHWYIFSDSKYKWCLIFGFLWLQSSPIAQSSLTLCDPMITAHQASLSVTNSRSLHKPMSIESVMPSSHLILSRPFSVPSPSQHQCLFQWVNSLCEVAKVLKFQLQHQYFQWTPRADLL